MHEKPPEIPISEASVIKPAESKEATAEQLELFEKAAATQGQKIETEMASKEPWIRNHIEQAADWYKKQPLKYKVLASLGFVSAASLSATIGGAVGMAIATAAFTGSMGQRMLGGLATFVAVEGLLKKAAEKEGRERGVWEARRHTMEAAVAGILVGTGSLSVAMKNIFGTMSAEDAREVVGGMKTSGAEDVVKQGEYAEVAQSGDSVWSMAERQLARQYGEKFAILDEAHKTYLVDAVKDKIAENPHSFGLTDPDQLAVGQSVDFSSIFENRESMAHAFQGVATLNESDIQNILDNNAAIREWASEHCGASTTAGKAEEILSGASISDGAPESLSGAELVGSSPPMTDAVLDKMVRDDIFNDQVHYVYRHLQKGFSGHALAEWNVVKERSAFDILVADGPKDQAFGDAVRGGMDLELHDRTQMHNYVLQLTRESHTLPQQYESVENFIKRAIDKIVNSGHAPQTPSPSVRWLSSAWLAAI